MSSINDIFFFFAYDPNKKLVGQIKNKPAEFYEGMDYFAGTVRSQTKHLKETESEIKLQMGSLDQYGFSITFNKKNKDTDIKLDRFSMYPIFAVQCEDGSYFVSNATIVVSFFFPEMKLDPVSIKTFFTKGYLFPQQTFLSNCMRVGKNVTIGPNKRINKKSVENIWQVVPRYTSTDLQSEKKFKELALLFQQNLLTSLPTETENVVFQMGGGGDSRALSITYLKSKLTHPYTEIAVSSWVQELGQADLDAAIAEKWCLKHSIPHKVRLLDIVKKDYLPFYSKTPLLTGILGGDYWGGTYQISLPTALPEMDRSVSTFIDDNEELENYLESLKSTDDGTLKGLRRQIMAQSDRSVFFRNISTGFACPAANQRRAYSPFLSTSMMSFFLECDDSLHTGYRFYSNVLKDLHGKDFFPICSFLNSVDSSWDAPAEWGINPKLHVPPYKPSHPDEAKQRLELFTKILTDRCSGFKEEELNKIIEKDGAFHFISKIYSFLNSLHIRYLEQFS